MSRNAKIGIGVVIGVLGLCTCVCLAGFVGMGLYGDRILEQMAVQDPQQARQQAAAMLDYDLPPGFNELGLVNFLTGKMLVIHDAPAGSQAGPSVVILVTQLSSSTMLESEQFRDQFQAGLQQAMQGQEIAWRLVSETTSAIRGQQVQVYTYEGEDEQGQAMRQMTTDVFEGKSGMLFITIIGTAQDWRQDRLDAFLASIQ
ncbi:MAG: hypothetical protein QME21_19600 [Anaerolineales bacterium]|nr:hypothetical protein [Anaerolineales bacterium]